MKAIESNPANISIALVYCFFGVLSFFVLKIAAKYFIRKEKDRDAEKSQMEPKMMSKKYLDGVSFSKVFLKTYLMKNTLIGSILNNDKKYLLKEIFVLSCIAVSCFNINTYIMWPWSISLGMSFLTLVISQVVIPLIIQRKNQVPIAEQSQVNSNLNDGSIMGLIQIQINTRIEMIISSQGEETISKNTEKKLKQEPKQKFVILEMFFIMVLAFASEVLICSCIVKLSLSVSNSGILNLISFGIALLIDQIGARIGLGIFSYTACFVLQKGKLFNFMENRIFLSCCSEAISHELRRVYEQAQIQAQNNKIANQSNLPSKNLNETGAKMIHENCFEFHSEKVQDQLSCQVNPSDQAVLEEQGSDQEQNQEPEIQVEAEAENQNETEKSEQKPSEPEIIKDETNYCELYSHDIETFTQQPASTNRSIDKPKKIKKRVIKPQEKFKSDPLLYLPFEEHKLSSHRNSIKQELKSFEDEMSLFEKEKLSVDGNLLKNIEVLECVDDSIVTEEVQMGTVLNEKNLNIKTLTMNQKAQIPPTSRPTHSATKRSFSKDSIGLKKVKKVSPYFVDLQSEAIKPQKSQKPRKLMVSKINKENANQTNQSFMPSTIEISRVTQKQFRTLDLASTQNQKFARR